MSVLNVGSEFLERLAAQDAMQVDSRGVEEVQGTNGAH